MSANSETDSIEPITNRINTLLCEYYKLNNNDTYYSNDKRGLFAAFGMNTI